MRPEDREDENIILPHDDAPEAEQPAGEGVHSEYKVPERGADRITHHLSGMYQSWFLD